MGHGRGVVAGDHHSSVPPAGAAWQEAGAGMSKLMSRSELVTVGVLLVAVVLFPFVLGDNRFMQGVIGYTMVVAIFAYSIYIMLSWTGEMALGQSLYFGLGAYVSALLMKDSGLPFLLAMLLAIVVSAVLALVLGMITLRLTGSYFTIVSWGVSAVAVVVANSLKDVTGGALGLIGIPTATIGPLGLNDPKTYLWVGGVTLILVVLLLAIVRRSAIGVRANAARMNRKLAQSLGAPVYRDRVWLFVLSASVAALSGAFAVSYFRIVTPGILGVFTTVDALLMVLLGGVSFLLGPVIGAFFFRLVPEAIQISPEVRTLVFSVLIIVLMLFAPGGLPEVVQRVKDLWGKRRSATRGSGN